MVGVDAGGGARHRAGDGLLPGRLQGAGARVRAPKFPGFVRLVQDKFRIDELYDLVLIRPDPRVSRGLFAFVDRIIVDKILVEGTGVLVDVFSRLARAVQGGDGQRYMAVFAVGVALLVHFASQPTLPFTKMKVTQTGRAVEIDARRGNRAPTRPLEYAFDFGDGRPVVKGASPEQRHDYDRAGSYTIHVTISDPRWGTEDGFKEKVEVPLMGVLAWITLLPLFGAGLVMLVPREEEAIHRGLGLLTALVDVRGVAADPARLRFRPGRLSAAGGQGLDRAARHPLPPGHRRHLAVAGAADDVPAASDAAVAAGDRHPQRARARVHRRDAGAGERDDRRFSRAGPVRLLRLLGADADPDVLHHRDLGRRSPPVRGDQVRHLHAGRLAADAGGDPVPVFAVARRDGHLQLRLHGPVAPDAADRAADALLRRLRAGVRDQGADLPAAHLAARRARRGADGRFGHPGRACC